ncbi:MAG: hypothetical protein HZA49_10340 [Planctomycetes bacterium]|nr:hypothetical protein [Planctomycetota bacterium]
MKSGKDWAGFTLIELLVVITIVIIIMSISVVSLLPLLKGNPVKYSAQIVQGVFRQTAQYAATERRMHFIVFDKEKSFMSIYKDGNDDPDVNADPDNEFNKSKDTQVGVTVALSKGVLFSDQAPLFELDEPYVGFRPNGSLVLPDGVSDLSLKNPEAENADIILEQRGKSGTMYLDFTITTGRIIKMIYREK